MPRPTPARRLAALLLLAFCAARLAATETENIDMHILPAPGPVTVDGASDDWDLSSGVFACGDVENARDSYGVWVHAMWDARGLYLFARWQDLTPLSNPGSIKGDYGFNGDCLQVRLLTAPPAALAAAAAPAPQEVRDQDDPPGCRTTHLSCWRDRDGLDTINVSWGRRFKEGGCEGRERGGLQAFRVHADKRGYDQELFIPWALVTRDGWQPVAGARLCMTAEPNFNIAGGGRLTIKDIFTGGGGIDRVFTFTAPNSWGFATLEGAGHRAPRAQRLSDGREFPVRVVAGLPEVDWTGLARSHEPQGFKPLRFTLDADGYVSLNIFRADGSVARQLLASAFYPKGEHEVRWDGLGTMSVRTPGQPLPPGAYTWGGLWHPGIGLRLRGWAASSSDAPWGDVWGADHGNPIACASDGERIYVGWNGGEGAKPLLACDPAGHILWKQIRGGLASASLVACADGTVYAWNDIGQYATRGIYRVDARTGAYSEWSALKRTDLTMADLWGTEAGAPERPNGIAAGGGRLYLSFDRDLVVAVDARTGLEVRRFAVRKPSALQVGRDGRVYVLSESARVVVFPADGSASTVAASARLADKEDWASALAVGPGGEIYLGIRGAHHHVQAFAADGSGPRTIGRPDGRAPLGPWDREGMLAISGLAVDGTGQLWVAEDDAAPRRVSVWDVAGGGFRAEYFGAASYGAIGGAINPRDPYLMIGQGCEWRIDATTGRATCLGVVTRDGVGAARFGSGPDGRLYLAVTPGFLGDGAPVRIFERLGDGVWKLRTKISRDDHTKQVVVWADANDDGQEQPDEVRAWPDRLEGWLQGWYMPMTPDLAFCGSLYQVAVSGWTACHAPLYDIDQARRLPGPEDGRLRGGMGAQHNHGSVDGRFVLWNGLYGEDHTTLECFDVASGQRMWTYPSNFTGVHGSHRAVAPEVGMIRGAYDICGAAKLPAPVGNVWVIPTNKGEWHVLTEKGYYLTHIFEGDAMKVEWPAKAAPGVDVSHCPPGAGEEAFGGALVQGTDGAISLQAGHASFWNIAVTGLEGIKALPGGALELSAEDVEVAGAYRRRSLELAEGARHLAVPRATPTFTGDLAHDFPAAAVVAFSRQDNAKVRAALTWDATGLHAGWEVQDDTPWVNGADAAEFMYARGDTVDLQLGTDRAAPPGRSEAGQGDLRLSIGSFNGRPRVVVYRRVATEKHPHAFHSGVVKDYAMDSVVVLDETQVHVLVTVAPDHRSYTVEADLPSALLGLAPAAGLRLRGDLGATHGNRAGDDTVLRTYWCNLNTGLVSDEVYELQMTPSAWGEMVLGD